MIEEKESPLDSVKSSGAEEILKDKNTDIIMETKAEIELKSGKVEANPFPMYGMPEVLADLINDSYKVYVS